MPGEGEGDGLVMEQDGTRAVIGERLAGRLVELAEQVRRLDPPGTRDADGFGRDRDELAERIAELGRDAVARLGRSGRQT